MLVIVHLNKGLSVEPLRRVGGSIGIMGAARSALLLARDPGDETRRVLAHFKCNVGSESPSLLYALEPTLLPASDGLPSVETVRLVELGESELGHSDLLAPTADEEERSALDEATEFLRAELAAGPRPAKAMKREAKDAGIKTETLKRAKKRLGVKSEREGGVAAQGAWVWRLPERSLSGASELNPLAIHELDPLRKNGSTMRESAPTEPLSGSSCEFDALSEVDELDRLRGKRDGWAKRDLLVEQRVITESEAFVLARMDELEEIVHVAAEHGDQQGQL